VYAPGHTTLVAEHGGQLVSFAHMCPARDSSDDTVAEITTIYVAPDSWRTGVGRCLTAAALDQILAAGFAKAVLWVLSTNE
jgi:N-acetylglutamate synthase-like GNAT family acetyltransferase